MKAKREVAALRAEIAGFERRGRRYPPEVRERVIAYAEAHRADDMTPKQIGDDLGVNWRTVKRWLEDAYVPGFERLIVQKNHPKPVVRIVVHGPGGVRIEGLALDELIKMLRMLK